MPTVTVLPMDDIYPNCAQPVPGFRFLWSVLGTKSVDNVRFRVESTRSSGWIGVGFHNGLCDLASADCMQDTGLVHCLAPSVCRRSR